MKEVEKKLVNSFFFSLWENPNTFTFGTKNKNSSQRLLTFPWLAVKALAYNHWGFARQHQGPAGLRTQEASIASHRKKLSKTDRSLPYKS